MTRRTDMLMGPLRVDLRHLRPELANVCSQDRLTLSVRSDSDYYILRVTALLQGKGKLLFYCDFRMAF